MFAHYRMLIELRHTEPVVAHGDFTMLLPGHETVYAFTRRLGDRELLVLANFADAPTRIDAADLPPGWEGTESLIGNYPGPAELTDLRAWEARVHRRIG